MVDNKDSRYYDTRGDLRWGHPVNVGHLIAQLQTMDPEMKVSSVTYLPWHDNRKARAFGLSMSRERWGEDGYLNYKLPIPDCLAFWANVREPVEGLVADNHRRPEFDTLVSGWTLVSGFNAITERIEEVARWAEKNRPLLPAEEKTVELMIQCQIARGQAEGVV